VRSTIWSQRASAAFRREIRYLDEKRNGAGIALEAEVVTALRHIATLPYAGRSVFVGDLRVWSLTNWRKIIIYQVNEETLKIVAFRDTRQDT
jgi:plasmid stabilization system protein ParE